MLLYGKPKLAQRKIFSLTAEDASLASSSLRVLSPATTIQEMVPLAARTPEGLVKLAAAIEVRVLLFFTLSAARTKDDKKRDSPMTSMKKGWGGCQASRMICSALWI